jgi:hypothetical protein
MTVLAPRGRLDVELSGSRLHNAAPHPDRLD